MIDLTVLAHPGALDGWAVPESVRRGRAYHREGRVVTVSVEHDGDDVSITGLVRGEQLYRTSVGIYPTPARPGQPRPRTASIDSTCSCPVLWACKHAVAVVLAAAAQSSPPSWRDNMDALLADLDATPEVTAPTVEPTPLALMLVLPAPSPHRYRAFDPPSGHPRLTVRLTRRGKSGRWVKGGMSWRELSSVELQQNARYDPEHIQLLRELQVALQAGLGYWNPGGETLDLPSSGPSFWPLLARLQTAGVPWVCSDPAVEVRTDAGTASLELDLREDADGVRVRPGARCAGRWYEPSDVAFIGEPAHGVALWSTSPDDRSITLAPLPRPAARAVRSQIVQGSELVVPREALPELVTDYLPRLRDAVEVGSSDGSVSIPGPPEIRLRGQVTWHEDASATLTWRWVYDLGVGPAHDLPGDDRGVGQAWRDLARERQLLDGLEVGEALAVLLGWGRHGPGTLPAEQRFRGLDAMTFADTSLPELTALAAAHDDLELALLGEPPEFREATGAPVVRFEGSEDSHAEGRTDWLDLEVVVTIDDEELGTVQVGLAAVLAALADGSHRVMVRKGVWVDVDRPELDQLARLVADARAMVEQPRDVLRLSRHHHDLLADLDEIGPTDDQVGQWVRAASALRHLDATEPPPVPVGLRATLRPYQRSGFQWLSFLHEHGLGGVLADDMGLGKTVQTLAMVARSRELTPDAPPFLVVAPSSVVGTWQSEAARFTPGLRVQPITEAASRRGWALSTLPERAPDLVVTSYTLLRLEAEGYAALPWSGLVLDEAQLVKNHASRTHAVVRSIEAGSRFAITGTPMENNLMELWSILSLTAPGLFPHPKDFQTRFARPIEQDADADALALLRRRIAPVMLRRTKELVAADLPPKQEQVLSITLSPKHRKLYDTHLQRERQRILKLLDDLDENRITILASLTRLRQLSLDPALVDADHAGVGSAKVDALVEHLHELAAEGHRALVFSQFTTFLTRIRERLAAEGLASSYLDGRTRKRPEVIERFRTGTDPVFLISLKAGGVGLTLTEADYCFLLDPWWNPAVENQAIDRTHRIGQTRPVNVYRLVSEATIEERVMALAQRKADLFGSVVDADALGSASLTADDIAALLG